LKINDFIIINGVTYKITAPPRKLPKREEVTIGQRRKSMVVANDDDNDNGGGVKSRRASFITKHSFNDVDDDDDDNDDSGEVGEDDNKEKDNNNEIKLHQDEELIEEYTDDHIKLDRPYMMDDIYDTDIYKVLPRIFYYQPLYFLLLKFIEFYPIQKCIAILAITQHKYIQLLERLKSNFDEENENYINLQRRIEKVNKRKYKFLNSSRSIVQMNFGFTLQRRVYSVLKTIVMTGIYDDNVMMMMKYDL